YLIYSRVHQTLTKRRAEIAHTFVSAYAPRLEMAGASVSICHLDAELSEPITQPAASPCRSHGPPTGTDPPRAASSTPATATVQAPKAQREIETVESPGPLRETLLAVATKLPAHNDELRELDAALGDGDLGITVTSGAEAVQEALQALPSNASSREV